MNKIWWVVWHKEVGNGLILPINCWRWDGPLQANSHSSPSPEVLLCNAAKSLFSLVAKRAEINRFKKISSSI